MSTFSIDEIGEVEVIKSSRAKRLILSVKPDGTIRLTVPKHIPLVLAKQYAIKNKDWIKNNTQRIPKLVFGQNQAIGRHHKLVYKRGGKLASRVSNTEVTITVPQGSYIEDSVIQKETIKACTRAIRREAELYLPKRLYELAQKYNFSFKEVRCKSLKTRWGSCSSEGVINLNIWLMQLSDDLVDYVLVHELTHLDHPNHQQQFWNDVGSVIPNFKQLRKDLKSFQPYLATQA